MADRWMDERDRDWRDRDWRRSEAYGRGGEDRRGTGQGRRWDEDRSWSRQDQDDEPYSEYGRLSVGPGEYGARSGGYAAQPGRADYAAQGSYQPPQFNRQDYTGRSQGAQGHGGRGYDATEDYRRRTRDYEDDPGQGRDRGFRSGGWEDEGERAYDNRALERRYAGEMGRRSSGATGGYDYERGYGDAGRSEQRGREPWEARRDENRERTEGGGDFLQRAGERISSWFRGDNFMRGSREEDREGPQRYREDFGREARSVDPGHRGRGPKGYQRTDQRISDEVHDRLTDDPWLDASDIQVEVKDGEVTLTGHVDNRESKHRAERLIEDLSGVRHVQNNLRINPNAGLTGAGRGFGSQALEAEMRRNEQATDPNNNGVSGLSGRTSTGALAERSTGTATETSVDPKTGVNRK